MIALNKTRTTVLLLALWFAFVFLIAYLGPSLNSNRTASAPARPPAISSNPSSASKSSDTAEVKALDNDNDGIPDTSELTSFAARDSFRRWFTRIAEMQFYRISDQWNREQRDCSGMVRFAWREALRRHDRLWFQKMGPGYEAIAPDVKTSDEGRTLGDKLFRTAYGRYEASDLQNGKLSEFADASTLKNFNVTFISRNRHEAQPGDLLFFYQPWVKKFPYHVMIFIGDESLAAEGANDWVVYHTGASPTDEGTVKKVRLSVLDHHPDSRWRPLESNRNFVGFYRLKILG